MKASDRFHWVDIARGYGMLLVIFSHSFDSGHILFHLIFMFHMPLFLLLSGFVRSSKRSAADVIRINCRKLLLPYVLFFLLGLAVTLIVPIWAQKFTWRGAAWDLYYATPDHVHNSSIWFLICLFFTVLAFQLISGLSIYLQLIVITAVYGLGIWYSSHRVPFLFPETSRLPLVLDVVPAALVFFAIGYYTRREKILEGICSAAKWKKCLLLLISILLTCFVYRLNGYTNLHALLWKNPALYVIGGLAGSFALVLTAMLTDDLFRDASLFKRFLIWYGRNSLISLGIQKVAISLYIYFCNQKGIDIRWLHIDWLHTLQCTVITALIVCPLCILIVNAIASVSGRKSKTLPG